MRRVVLVVIGAVLGVLIALFVASQLIVPSIAEHRVASRLTADGGTAHVSLSAFPALRLLWRNGDKVQIRASGLNLPLSASSSSSSTLLKSLDKFGSVDVQISDSRAGPFKVSQLSIERPDGAHDYAVKIHSTVTAGDLATFAGGQIAGPIGGLLGGITSGAVPFTSTEVPIDVDSSVQSDGGKPVVSSLNGSIAGVPVGTIVQLLSGAVAGRI